MPLWRSAVQMPWTWTSFTPTPSTGQVPPASRYRWRYRLRTVYRVFLAVCSPLGVWLGQGR